MISSFLHPPRFQINHAADAVSEAIRKSYVLSDIQLRIFKRNLSKSKLSQEYSYNYIA